MIVSKLDESIIYPDIKSIDLADVGYDANLYEIEFFPEIKGIIALGNVKYTFSEKNILFIPVYLVNDDKISIQIGVYEFESSHYPNLLDEDNDFDITKLSTPEPLYYSFINKELLLKNGALEGVLEEEEEKNEEEKNEEEKKEKEYKENETSGASLGKELTSESRQLVANIYEEDKDVINAIDSTMNLDMDERRKFKKTANNLWIQNFMKNKLYNIIDNEGGGDCLFAVIRDGFKSIDKTASVNDLRKIISENATQTIYNDFKEQYDMYKNGIREAHYTMNKLSDEVKELKLQKKQQKGRNEQKAIIDLAKKKIVDFKRAKREKEYATTLLSDFRWMEGVDNLEKFKGKINTCEFWAEAWSINLLEILLNIKLIILSSQNYEERDLGNVLLCDRGFVEPSIEKKGVFTPKYYIIVDYTGGHYKLITYGENHIFTFNTIPYSLKVLIVEKCMEKNAGIYGFIPKFIAFKKQIIGEKIEVLKEDNTPEKETETSDMYDPTTIFQFYSKSSNKPLPGKGAGETIKKENIKKFSELATIKGWRKVLSNFYMVPFELDEHKWNSVEHYYQGSKFKKSHPEFYLTFSADSNSDLSKDPVLAKAYGGKTGKFKGKIVRPKEIKMDTDFFDAEGRGEKEMEAAQMAKYSQNEEVKKVLLATKDAKLVHYSRGSPPIVFNDSMRIRKRLASDKTE
jgi:predicted NAD-dependent protein-ADP-ribosyltransferase YbiA (DUF1768 family)